MAGERVGPFSRAVRVDRALLVAGEATLGERHRLAPLEVLAIDLLGFEEAPEREREEGALLS